MEHFHENSWRSLQRQIHPCQAPVLNAGGMGTPITLEEDFAMKLFYILNQASSFP